nr:PREDICTED: CD209 antigen-like protein E [Lepisosteus oculatus]
MDREYKNIIISKMSEEIYTDLISPDNHVYSTVDQCLHENRRTQDRQRVKAGCGPPPYRLIAVFLGLLCVVSLTGFIIQSVYCNGFLHVNQSQSSLPRRNELDDLSANYSALAAAHEKLVEEKEELKRENERLLSLNTDIKRLCKLCPQDWEFFQSKCYHFSTGRLSWRDSQADCRSQGADLVVIDSRLEQLFISRQSKGGSYWIGLSDAASEGTWLWVNGARETGGYWMPRQPDNHRGREDCAMIASRAVRNWNDEECGRTLSWICEAESPLLSA